MRTELLAATPTPTPTPGPTTDSAPLLTQPVATVIGGICVVAAGLLAFAVAYYNRRQTEKHWRTTNRQDRFSTIGTQLSDKSAAVRIAGVYAMEALIDDWLKPRRIPLSWYIFKPRTTWTKEWRATTRRGLSQRGTRQAQACVNVLCAYLRLPPIKDRNRPAVVDTINGQAPLTKPSDGQVRSSIIRTITAHLKPNPPGESWSKLDYDFAEAHLHNANFSGANFAGITKFIGTQFHGENTWFVGTQFHGEITSFDGAHFHSETTRFGGVQFHSEHTSFDEAQFLGEYTWFVHARFHGETTSFVRAQFHNEYTSFVRAEFHGMATSFGEAQFHSERTWFSDAQFHSEAISFDEVQFLGERTSFIEAQFYSKNTWFDRAQFRGETTFERPCAWSNMHFDWDWPLPDKQHGPAPAKPLTVEPEEWPPTLADNVDPQSNVDYTPGDDSTPLDEVHVA